MNKFRQNRIINFFKDHWGGILTTVIITALAMVTLSLQIGTLNEGQNRFETETISSISSFDHFKKDLVNAPYLLPAYGLSTLVDDPLMAARIISVAFSLLATALIFMLLKHWFNARTASVGSLIFITSAWLLSIAHQATPFIMLVFMPLLLILYLSKSVNSKEDSFKPLLMLFIGLALAVYIPFMPWIVFIVIISLISIFRKNIIAVNLDGYLLLVLIMILLLAPLGYSLYNNPDQIKVLLGLPQQIPSTSNYILTFFKQFGAIFIYTEKLPELFIYQKPLIDVFSAAMFALGIYYFFKFISKKTRIVVSIMIIVLTLLIPLQKDYLVALTVLLPFVFLFIPAGIHEMMRRWHYVFPRNPIARTGAAILLVVAIGLSVTYNLQKFYIAWPNTPDTKAAYMIESKEQ